MEVGIGKRVNVQSEVDSHQPIHFESVELGDGNAANLGPRAVLKCVVVQELAPEQERNCQHAPDLAIRSLVGGWRVEHGHSLGQVVQSKENRRTWESRR